MGRDPPRMTAMPALLPALTALALGACTSFGGVSTQGAGPSLDPSIGAAQRSGASIFAAPADEKAEDESETSEATPTRKWITHVVVPRETYDSIGERYGVSRAEIIKWNKKKLGKKQWLYARAKLRINARRFPPPRMKTTYIVQRGDTWGKIGKRFNVSGKDLQAWNPKVPTRFKAGTKLKVYTNPRAPKPSASGGASAAEVAAAKVEFEVRSGGLSVGRPNRGRLVHGVQLPASDMVKILDKDKVWGTSHTIKHLQEAISTFRSRTGYDKPLTVSSISLRNGGRFRPHGSHQTGRDADVRLPRKGATKGEAPSSIDWTMTWHLVKALVDTGEVQYIFISYSRQKYLRRAAASAGATKAELDKIIQYPRKPKTNKGVVRHSPGHTVHLHVRFTCTPGNERCASY